ncbi:hypothetical protein N9809_07350 [Amylibacter sp.]|nr:hypothetical protein [Amylibacter sp.]MDB4248188.1 hypothetical protein [Amylibacter sp.]|tara:strand:- start:111 stop:440 length:330 start_codon:yes stop_codon:yes gene_type:complete
MKKLLYTSALALVLSSTQVASKPSLMLGLAFNFGGDKDIRLGLTAKLLSSDQPNEIVGALGASYFLDDSFGLDAGLGYTFDNSAISLTYDFINERPQISAGFANIESIC